MNSLSCYPRVFAAVLFLLYSSTALTEDQSKNLLLGEWEIVKMVYRTNVETFTEAPGGYFIFDAHKFIYALDKDMRDKAMRDNVYRRVSGEQYIIISSNQIDITAKRAPGKVKTLKALYEIKNQTLWVIWPEDYGDRPVNFEGAATDPNLTFFILRRPGNQN